MTQEEEIQKCKDDPAYFYNTYTTQGQKRPLTPLQMEWYNRISKMQKDTHFVLLRCRQRDYIGQLIEAVKKLDSSLTEQK